MAGLVGFATGCRKGSDKGSISTAERERIPGTIAFVSERSGNKDVWLVRPTGEETQLTSGPEDEFPAAPAPDGSGLLVIATRSIDGRHQEQIRWTPLDKSAVVALGAPSGRSRNPSWAPDGSWFVAESDKRGFSDLVRLTPQPNASTTTLAAAPQGNFQPRVSPDGKEIAFVSSRSGDPEIYIMASGGGEPRRLTAFHKEDWEPKWSPDGAWIAFLSNREGRARAFIVKPDGTDTRPLTGTAPTGDEREIAWHPDSKSVALVGRQSNGTTRIWRASIAGGEPVALTSGTSRDDQPAWSPDGKYLAFTSERDGNTDVYFMRADGTGRAQLTKSPGADWLPRWF